jgi:hypothetical protein
MSHFNKLIHYEEDHYDDYDYDQMDHEIEHQDFECTFDRTDFALCGACKNGAKWDDLILHHNNVWLCPGCAYDQREEDDLDEILEEAYALSEDEIAILRNTHDTFSHDNSIHNFDGLQETEIDDPEAYQEKQFEDYLRLNPVDPDEEEDLPSLGIATVEKLAKAKELLDNYIDTMTKHNKNTCLSQIEDQNVDVWIDNYIINNQIQRSAAEEETIPLMTRCRCDDSPREYITCCECGEYEEEIYSFRYKSSLYCNTCAYEVCGILIDKPSNPIKDYSHDEDSLLDA